MRRWVALVVGSVGFAVALAAWFRPDLGPDVRLAAAPAPAPPRASAAPVVVTSAPPRRPIDGGPVLPTEELPEDEGFPTPIVRQPARPPPIDPDQVFAPDTHGLATAAVSRRAEMLACVSAYQDRTGEAGYEGRFTLKFTVSPAGDAGAVSSEVVNGPDDPELRQCLDASMADLRFDPPEHDVSMMWPIPMLAGPPDPR